MKIADIRVINIDQPRCQIPLVEVETDSGLIGIGATQAPVKPIAALIADIAPLLLGQDPTSPNRLWRTMNEGWQAQRGRGGEGGVAINAMATIDMALWDLTGKAHNVPVHKLMGGAVKDRIMAYASATAYDYTGSLKNGRTTWKTPAQLAVESRAYVEEGFKAIKFGWGNRFAPADLEGLAAVREAIGPDIRLMLDFGCPAYHDDDWTVKQALDVARCLEPYDLYFFEEALHPYDVEGFARLTAGARTRIATGESLVTQRDFDRFNDGRADDDIQPDAKQIGMTVFQRVARHAEAVGILCIPHSPWSALASAAHLQILSTVTNGAMIEYVAMAGFRGVPYVETLQEIMSFRLVETPPTLNAGWLELNDRPGLGLGQFVPDTITELTELEPVDFP